MDHIQIRLASNADAEKVSALVNSVYRGDPAKQGWTSEAHLLVGDRIAPHEVVEIISAEGQVILVVELESQVVGCVQLKQMGDKAYLGLLSVAAPLQAAGLGSQMLSACEHFVKTQWNCHTMFMWVITIRTELVQWYVRKGYSVTDERIPYSSVGADSSNALVDNLEFAVLEKSLL